MDKFGTQSESTIRADSKFSNGFLSVSSDFWSISNVSLDETESKMNASKLDLDDIPLEADKKGYSRVRALLIFWFISSVVILGYLVYFAYLIIGDLN